MRTRSEKGIALIAVIWIVALLAVIAATLSRESSLEVKTARNVYEIAIARTAAEAGIYRGMLALQDLATNSVDDRAVLVWSFSNCTVRIFIRDEASKIDLNKSSEPLLAALFTSVGVNRDDADALADSIADFRDKDDLKRFAGAEKSDYQKAGLEWGPKNAPFEAVEEMQQVLGVTPDIYRRVASDLSVYSLTAVIPATTDERLTSVVNNARLNPTSPAASPKILFSIIAEATTNAGAVFIRSAIVQRVPGAEPRILSWSHSTGSRLTH
jgi:general secretion pathway protein K